MTSMRIAAVRHLNCGANFSANATTRRKVHQYANIKQIYFGSAHIDMHCSY